MSGRILVASRNLPPSPGGTSTVITNLARQFKRDEMVVAGLDPLVGRGESSWTEDMPQVHYVMSQIRRSDRASRWWMRMRILKLARRLLSLAKRENCTAILAVYPPEEMLIAAYLAAKWGQIRFFPWYHNTWVESGKAVFPPLARWMQRKIFDYAEHVFTMSDGMAELFGERYPELSCSALRHAFNQPVPRYRRPAPCKTPSELIICGSVVVSCMDATLRLREAVLKRDDLRLTFLTGKPRAYMERMGLLAEGIGYDSVPLEKVAWRLGQADIVLLPHGLTGGLAPEEYQTIFPTKTIECLLSRKPMLAHSPPGSFLTRFLKDHDCALIVENPSMEEIYQAIDRLRTDEQLRARLVRNALKAVRMFEAPGAARELRDRVAARAS